MSIRSLFASILILSLGPALPAADRSRETVVLLHGILNRPFVMNKIERGLEKEGFRVLNWGYKSTDKTIEEYAVDLNRFVKNKNLKGPVHFVGFSLGSIIARYYLSATPPSNLGRFVQIAPPNHGSQWIDKLYEFKAFRWVYGDKAIQELKADSPFIKTLRVPACEFGIIAGGLGDGRGFNPVLPGDDDGSVALVSAQLNGAKDLIQVKSEHTLLLAQDATVRNVVSFLESGFFLHANGKAKGERP